MISSASPVRSPCDLAHKKEGGEENNVKNSARVGGSGCARSAIRVCTLCPAERALSRGIPPTNEKRNVCGCIALSAFVSFPVTSHGFIASPWIPHKTCARVLALSIFYTSVVCVYTIKRRRNKSKYVDSAYCEPI